MYDVAIIGAGVTGGMIARLLSGYRLSVCVLEKENDVSTGASCANSGIIHAGFDAPEGSLKAKLNVLGAKQMPEIAKELGVPYRKNGSLVVAFSEAERKELETLYRRGIANGVTELNIVNREELRRMEPNLREEAVGALSAPTAGMISPYELTIAAIGHAMENGVVLKRNFEVQQIEFREGVWRLSAKQDSVSAKWVVNAAGLYADRIAAMIGDTSFRIHPRRGEYLLLDKECGTLVHHTIFGVPGPMGKGILITPTAEGNLLLGPTSEDGTDKENKTTTAEGLERILSGTAMRMKELPVKQRITSFAGLRAVGDTGDFIIRSPKQGFVHVAGIESPGLTASPAIAEYVVSIMKDGGLELRPKERTLPPDRPLSAFRTADRMEKNRMIRENPAYGKIVCRCEGVTEGEIIDAIRKPPGAMDLDGIKRRTRAQMGRCQGGFCMPSVLELLSRELNVPVSELTKSGGGSFVVKGETK